MRVVTAGGPPPPPPFCRAQAHEGDPISGDSSSRNLSWRRVCAAPIKVASPIPSVAPLRMQPARMLRVFAVLVFGRGR